jgi:predicted dehydrogenase
MGISVGMVGVGGFAQCFIPLFKAHPDVDRIALCDLNEEKLGENCAKYDIAERYESLEAICDSDLDAVAIITQNWLHAPQAIQALRAGKDVYSAVPTGINVEEIAELVDAVKESGRVYMLGETSYYYPAVIYCRQRFREGAFGRIVYAEAQYYHDFDHGLYEVMQARGGDQWKQFAGGPPMHYPTHSVSAVTSVTGAHMTHVSCQGFVDNHEDGLFQKEANIWQNEFSNESAMFAMSDGSSCRINEFRRIGHPGTVSTSIFGTESSFETSSAGSRWLTKAGGDSVDDQIKCTGEAGMAPVHDTDRLPPELLTVHSGHEGSHAFMVDDFIRACITRETPPNNVWDAARYALPGIVAHESALRGGELLEIPDHGPPDSGNR